MARLLRVSTVIAQWEHMFDLRANPPRRIDDSETSNVPYDRVSRVDGASALCVPCPR